jgi:hypothetical protein
MRRLADTPIEYLIAGVLALALAAGIYVLHKSTASTPVTTSASVIPPPHRQARPSPQPAAQPSRAAQPGNPLGLALLRRAQKAYLYVGAVSATGRIAGYEMNFTIVLRHGQVVAESFLGRHNGSITRLVAPHGSTTYARATGSGCWRVVPAGNPAALDDVGHPFPYFQPAAHVLVPQSVPGGWAVNAEVKGQLEAFVLQSKTYLVRSMSVQQGALHVTMPVRILARAPHLPVPAPRCG